MTRKTATDLVRYYLDLRDEALYAVDFDAKAAAKLAKDILREVWDVSEETLKTAIRIALLD